MSKSKFLSACKPSANKDFSTGFGFCSVTFGWDINDSTYIRELLVSNKANGYHDILARIDTRTYRRLAWEKNMAFFLVEFYDPDSKNGETRLGACPRGLLESVTQKVEQHGEGWKCMAGSEFEVSFYDLIPGANGSTFNTMRLLSRRTTRNTVVLSLSPLEVCYRWCTFTNSSAWLLPSSPDFESGLLP